MKYRQTHEVIRAGQPRAYADTEYVAQVMFEHSDLKGGNFVPHYMDRESALRRLKGAMGYVEREKGVVLEGETGMDAAFATYLDYVTPINGDELVACTWEFRTVSRYND